MTPALAERCNDLRRVLVRLERVASADVPPMILARCLVALDKATDRLDRWVITAEHVVEDANR